jgi:hypothetical protein
VAPTSNSGGTFSYTSSDTSVATVSGTTVTILQAGTTTITAVQAETETYYGGSTNSVLTVISKVVSSLSMDVISEKTFGEESFTVSVSSNSDGSKTYTSSNTSVATITSVGLVTIVGAGSTTITVSQVETGNYFAKSVERVLTVSKAEPILTLVNIEKTYGDAGFTVSASSNSDGSKTYTSSNTNVATISGNMVTIISAGTTTITVSQVETSNYNSGTTTSVLTVEKAVSSLSMVSISEKTYGSVPFEVVVTTNSEGVISYTSSNTSVATVSSVGLVTIVGAGLTTISVTQGETSLYLVGNVEGLLTVKESSGSNPTVITGGSSLIYYLSTSATNAILSGDIMVSSGSLKSSSKKVIKASKRLTIKRG